MYISAPQANFARQGKTFALQSKRGLGHWAMETQKQFTNGRTHCSRCCGTGAHNVLIQGLRECVSVWAVTSDNEIHETRQSCRRYRGMGATALRRSRARTQQLSTPWGCNAIASREVSADDFDEELPETRGQLRGP
jgi:hypothetical protein